MFAITLKTLSETMGWRAECHRERHARVVTKGVGEVKDAQGGIEGGTSDDYRYEGGNVTSALCLNCATQPTKSQVKLHNSSSV